MSNDKKRLCKSYDDKIFAGVCGGLAEHFNFEAKKVRLAFFVFTLLGGSGIALYIILAILMD